MIASWMAWPWVCDTVEMSTPMPSVTNRKSAAPRANTATEPRKGTSKSSMPAPTTITMSRAAITMYGAILPTKTSRGRNGMTASCSMVPAWRSRTTPRAVATVPTKTRMMPHRPGIMMTAVRRSGLKRISALAFATESPPARRLRRQDRPVHGNRRPRHGDRGRRRHAALRRTLPRLGRGVRSRGRALPVRDAGHRGAHLHGVADPGPGHPARDDDPASPVPAQRPVLPPLFDGLGRALDRVRPAADLLHQGGARGHGPWRAYRRPVDAAGRARRHGARGVHGLDPALPPRSGAGRRWGRRRGRDSGRRARGGRGERSVSGWGVSGLTVRYGRRTALDDVTLDVPAGAVTAVIGGDGAGKTTLLRALAGVARPTGGTVHSPARRRIGYVAGASGLYDDLSVAENVAFVAAAYGVRGAELEAI